MESQKRDVTLSQLPTVLPRSGFVPVPDLAFWLGCSEHSVKFFVQKHKVRYGSVGGKWVVDLESLWTELFPNTRQ